MIFISFKYISSSLVALHSQRKFSYTLWPEERVTTASFFNFSKSMVDSAHAIPKQRENGRCSMVAGVD